MFCQLTKMSLGIIKKNVASKASAQRRARSSFTFFLRMLWYTSSFTDNNLFWVVGEDLARL